MNVDQSVVEDAVLQIFRELQVPPGGQLALETLREQWPGTQLRRSDLVQGVRALVFSGDLELDEESLGPVLILRVQGHERLQALPPQARSVWTLLVPKKLPPPAQRLRTRQALRGAAFGKRKSDVAPG
ncbi:MAG TPA: hypothetical protein VLI06_09105 [Solimonas sp.]|nr:hypothetical protein [Solimonas sp.]